MCLTRAATETEKRYEFNVRTDVEGRRKAFKVLTPGGELPFQGMGDKLPKSRWVNEKKYRYDSDIKSLPFCGVEGAKRYVTGFHIFVSELDAIRYSKSFGNSSNGYNFKKLTVKEVYFRKVVARGYQDKYRVIVCKEIALVA
jgi:pullulanase/glycogen debranching enzyme